jgi:Recombination endonuclease VII
MKALSIKKGQKFDRLTVISRAEKQGRLAWSCKCTCGNTRVIYSASLKSGKTKSCGCLHRDISVGKTKERAGSIIGRIIGKWHVIDLSPRRTKSGGVYFICECECGQKREVSGDGLLAGKSLSCGNCKESKPICIHGHIVAAWGGRAPSGACKACIKHKSLMRNYGWSLEEIVALWERQGRKCAICGAPLELIPKGGPGWSVGVRAEVDHEHLKGVPRRSTVRGILCGGRWKGCNRRLGKIDNLPWLNQVIHYLSNPPARGQQ